ncbi:MAG: hypothetical protein HC924_02275 [Synechococcaceae cyanobacterium SM2_3_2]|nr:hypothetical protein [Synechococcaceae cyanobacterium SM2_3_2]
MSTSQKHRFQSTVGHFASAVVIGLAAVSLGSCGSDNSGSTIQPLPSAPVINLINPPTTLRIGQTSPFFPVEVSASSGIRSSRFFEIEIFRPNGTLVRADVFDASTAGCASGATFCTFQAAIEVGSGNPTGRYQVRYSAFDQQNRQTSLTTFVDVSQ